MAPWPLCTCGMHRRQFLTGTAAALALSTVAGNASASGGTTRFTDVGVNKFDADDDDDIGIYFRPAQGRVGGRGGVRHLVSDGAEGDYVTAVQPIPPTEIGDFTGSNPTTLEYDYYDTETNEAATPDEVWVRVRDQDGTRSFYRASNDNDEGGAVGEWLTREIHNEIVGDPQYNEGFKWFEVTPDGIVGGSESLVDLVGEDASLIHVGTGGSNFGGNVITDFYVDKLRLDGRPIGHFPAEGRAEGGGNGRGN